MQNIKIASSICGLPAKSQTNTPIPPDPTFKVTEFLQWLKKRGAIRKLSDCVEKWEIEGLNIESVIKTLQPYLCIYRYKGEKVVKLENKPWADQWMSHYNLEVPHHRHMKEMEKMISVTEKERKV